MNGPVVRETLLQVQEGHRLVLPVLAVFRGDLVQMASYLGSECFRSYLVFQSCQEVQKVSYLV